MNKKLIYIFAVLVVGLFVISACSSLIKQEEVGARADNRIADGINVIPMRNTLIIDIRNGDTYNGLTLNGVYRGADNQRSYNYCDVTYNRRRENIIEKEVKNISVPGENQVYIVAYIADIENGMCRLIFIRR